MRLHRIREFITSLSLIDILLLKRLLIDMSNCNVSLTEKITSDGTIERLQSDKTTMTRVKMEDIDILIECHNQVYINGWIMINNLEFSNITKELSSGMIYPRLRESFVRLMHGYNYN